MIRCITSGRVRGGVGLKVWGMSRVRNERSFWQAPYYYAPLEARTRRNAAPHIINTKSAFEGNFSLRTVVSKKAAKQQGNFLSRDQGATKYGKKGPQLA